MDSYKNQTRLGHVYSELYIIQKIYIKLFLEQMWMNVIYSHAKTMGLASTRLDHTHVNVRQVGKDKIAILVSRLIW